MSYQTPAASSSALRQREASDPKLDPKLDPELDPELDPWRGGSRSGQVMPPELGSRMA